MHAWPLYLWCPLNHTGYLMVILFPSSVWGLVQFKKDLFSLLVDNTIYPVYSRMPLHAWDIQDIPDHVMHSVSFRNTVGVFSCLYSCGIFLIEQEVYISFKNNIFYTETSLKLYLLHYYPIKHQTSRPTKIIYNLYQKMLICLTSPQTIL